MTTGTSVVTWLAVLAAGQMPAGDEVHHVNFRNPEIPIILPQDPVARSQIKQLSLYVSTDQGKTWNQVAVASPTQTGFPFVAPADGLYWFQVVSIDQQGVSDPPVEQISTLPPKLRTVVDTRKPIVKLSAERKADQVIASWQVQDEYLNLSTLKLEYQNSDSPVWTPVSIVPAAANGSKSWTVGPAGAVTVRLQVQDAAGNTAIDERRLPADPIQNTSVATAPPPPAPPVSPFATPPSSPSAATPLVAPPPALGAGLPTPPTAFPVRPPVAEWQPGGPVKAMPPTAPVAPVDEGRRIIASSHGSGHVATAPGASYTPSPTSAYPNPATPTGARPRGKLPEVQFVNTHHLELDYQVKVGPSGVGSVELWVTQDDGQTWKPFANDEDLQPPFVVDVPEDGPYGFMMIVKSRAGLGRKAPAPGDAPDVRLEVDTTPPVVTMYVPEADPKRRDMLQLLWTATDRNLGNANVKPVTWQMAESLEGPWRNIASELPNTGKYVWPMPQNLPYEVYLRVIVRDLAGNEATATTDLPVQVDLVEPEITFKGLKPPAPATPPKPIGSEVPSARLPIAPPR